MEIEEHLTALRAENALLAKALARVELDAMVPSCPEWTVRELLRHLGRMHRWATAYVGEARPRMASERQAEKIWGAMPGDADLAEWLTGGLDRLIGTIEGADDDLQCWTFLAAPSPLAFWARREAHETAIHRADAEAVLHEVSDVEAEFAADGVDELLRGFFARPGRLRSRTPRLLAIEATDTGTTWLLHLGSDGTRAELTDGLAGADAWISAPAQTLYYGLWNRVPLTGTGGDPSVLELWRRRATVRW